MTTQTLRMLASVLIAIPLYLLHFALLLIPIILTIAFLSFPILFLIFLFSSCPH